MLAGFMLLNAHLLNEKYTLSLNSISALYPVFSQFIVTTPPNSIVSVPIKIPAKNNYRVGSQVKKLHSVTTLACYAVWKQNNVKKSYRKQQISVHIVY